MKDWIPQKCSSMNLDEANYTSLVITESFKSSQKFQVRLYMLRVPNYSLYLKGVQAIMQVPRLVVGVFPQSKDEPVSTEAGARY